MKVYAMSRLFAVDIAGRIERPYAIISLTDPKSELPEFAPNTHRLAVLGQKFYDIDFSKQVMKDDEPEIRRLYGAGLFTDEQAKEIVQFVDTIKDRAHLLIVHCDAGVSRSAGVAGAILKALTGSDEKIFNDPMFLPNMWVYRKVLNAFQEVETDA